MGCPKGAGHQFWWGWIKKIMECLTMPPTMGNPDSYWSFHKPYFVRKHTFHKWYRKNRRNDWPWNLQISAKLFGNVIISKTFLLMISIIIHFLSSKFCKHLQSRKNQTAKTGQLTIQTFCTICFTLLPEKYFVKLWNMITDIPCNRYSTKLDLHYFLWDIFLTQVNPKWRHLSKNYATYFVRSIAYEISWSWNQNFVISTRSWNNF